MKLSKLHRNFRAVKRNAITLHIDDSTEYLGHAVGIFHIVEICHELEESLWENLCAVVNRL